MPSADQLVDLIQQLLLSFIQFVAAIELTLVLFLLLPDDLYLTLRFFLLSRADLLLTVTFAGLPLEVADLTLVGNCNLARIVRRCFKARHIQITAAFRAFLHCARLFEGEFDRVVATFATYCNPAICHNTPFGFSTAQAAAHFCSR